VQTVITPQVLSNLNVTFSTKFNDAYSDLANQTPIWWDQLAEEVPSGTLSEVFGWMKQIPGYRKWIDDRVIHTLDSAGYTITSDKFELTMGVKRDDIVYDRLGIYTKLAGAYGAQARQFRDTLIWPLIKGGASAVGPDGQYFYDTDHPLTDINGQATTAANFTSGAGPLWFLVAKPGGIKPFIITKQEDLDFVPMTDMTDERVFSRDEFRWGSKGRFGAGYFLWQLIEASTAAVNATNFNQMFTNLSTRLGDKGTKMPLMPTDAYFPLSLRGDAATTLLVDKLANGASNFNFKVVDVHFVPWLDWQ
jgi:phage major head subunit gpT-like protein